MDVERIQAASDAVVEAQDGFSVACCRLTDALERLTSAVASVTASSGRVPADQLRRPDHPGQRQPGDELGEEVTG